jgi:DNA-binding CsgD family transcriptional regulator
VEAQTAAATLVVLGEAGLGKTALLDAATARARPIGARVLEASGVEAESELAFAGLHQLLRPVFGHVDDVPARQADALRTAFGLGDQASPDRFLIGLATLTLLADVADHQPVLVVLDDAQWFDRGSLEALAFTVRRLQVERIAVLIASRTEEPLNAVGLHGPRLTLAPLAAGDAADLLDVRGTNVRGMLRTRVLAEAAGNPLALIELGMVVSHDGEDASDAGGSAVALPPTARVERLFSSQLQALPEPSRLMLLLAAAADASDLRPVVRAAERTGLPLEALVAAEHAELLSTRGDEFKFRHPLIRTVVYHSASYAERKVAHLALASVLADDPERRAWHLAAVTLEPDEAVAALLEASADGTSLRGGFAAAASALERAADLSPQLDQRARRLVRATEMAFAAGRPPWVEYLARRVTTLTDDAHLRGLADQRVAQIQALSGQGGSVPEALSTAALESVMHAAPEIGVRRLVVAAGFAFLAGQRDLLETAYALVRSIPGPGNEPWRLFVLAAADPIANQSAIRAAVEACIASPPAYPDIEKMVAHIPWFADDSASAAILLGRAVDGMRTRGDIGAMGSYLSLLGFTSVWRGRWLDARAIAAEVVTLATDINQPNIISLGMALDSLAAALQGDGEAAHRQATAALALTDAGLDVAVATWALGLADLAEGRPAEAYEQLRRLFTPGRAAAHFAIAPWAIADLVEAATASGIAEMVQALSAEALRRAEVGGSVRAVLVARRAHAALAAEHDAATQFERALSTPGAEHWPFEFARTQLTFGAWLRRHRRVVAARPLLQAAIDAFDQLGARPWLEQARAELRAAGVASESRPGHAAGELTPQERQVAQMAAQGLTNREIGERLFLSPRTVGFHLHNVFPKLQVTTRTQLARLLVE